MEEGLKGFYKIFWKKKLYIWHFVLIGANFDELKWFFSIKEFMLFPLSLRKWGQA